MNVEILLEMQKEMGVISAHVSEIKADVREHMKRTAILETEVKFLHRQAWVLYGVLLAVGTLLKFGIHF